MGWDGYAILPNGEHASRDESVKRQFHDASEAIFKSGLSRDCLLEVGALDVSTCAYAIQKMTKLGAWIDHTAQEVRLMAARAEAYELEEEDEPWAFASAKAFLLVSAANGCSFEASF